MDAKIYDGNTEVTGHHGLEIGLEGLVNGDEGLVYGGVSGGFAFDTPDVGENKTITATGIFLMSPGSQTKYKNYKLLNETATGNVGVITQQMLHVYAQSFTYSGGTTFEAELEGVQINYWEMDGEREIVTATLTTSGKNVGDYTYTDEETAGEWEYTVTLDSGNYYVSGGGMLTIRQREVA